MQESIWCIWEPSSDLKLAREKIARLTPKLKLAGCVRMADELSVFTYIMKFTDPAQLTSQHGLCVVKSPSSAVDYIAGAVNDEKLLFTMANIKMAAGDFGRVKENWSVEPSIYRPVNMGQINHGRNE